MRENPLVIHPFAQWRDFHKFKIFLLYLAGKNNCILNLSRNFYIILINLSSTVLDSSTKRDTLEKSNQKMIILGIEDLIDENMTLDGS